MKAPTPSSSRTRQFILLGVLMAGAPGVASAAAGQDELASIDRPTFDSALVRDDAEAAQARFERDRRRFAPRAPSGSWGGSCDEIVGRMCMRFEGGSDWWPTPEPPELTEARDSLLERLSDLARMIPGDSWILGQRVRYLIEADRPESALALANDCGIAQAWWCEALAGLSEHVRSDFSAAESRFDRALEQMPSETRSEWLDAEWLMDSDGRDLLDTPDEQSRAGVEGRFWHWSDPLFLVEGNDFRTEMMSRRAMNRVSEDARNGYSMRWGDDLEELLVRYGWELGWEVTNPRMNGQIGALPSAVGHQHPESRDYSAPGRALDSPVAAESRLWNPQAGGRTTTGYAPSYAPVIAPARVELLKFPRGHETIVVGLIELEPDTSYHRSHGHEPLPLPEVFSGRPAQRGLFFLPRDEGGSGVTMKTVPAGEYLLSAEVWYPDSARAGRVRTGLDLPHLAPDVAATSDLALADPEGGDPEQLEDLIPHLVFGPFEAGTAVRVAWEVTGIGLQQEVLEYDLRLEKRGGGLLRRVGGLFGLGRPDRPVQLSWTEAGPEQLKPTLRSVVVSLPGDLEPGEYTIQVELRSMGRAPLVIERRVEVLPAR